MHEVFYFEEGIYTSVFVCGDVGDAVGGTVPPACFWDGR